jgi:VCBS repeat-containing protein
VDSKPPETDQRPVPRKDPPYFLYFLLILLLFLGLDSADTALIALFTPTVHVTIIPQTNTIRTTATVPLASIHARVLPGLTLIQSQNTPATGHGHQNAKEAAGIVTFYNGLSTAQSVARGTVLTGQDGISVATDQAVTISPANPPSLGETSVTAHAVNAGTSGNIQTGDINTTLATGLFAKNTAPFSGGQDERNFTFVKSSDIQHAIDALTPKLLQSEQAALTTQLQPQERLVSPTCKPTTTSNHQPGDEAIEVQVTVSEACSTIAFNKGAAQTQASRILNNLAAKKLGTGYRLFGSIQVTVTQAAHTPQNLVLSLQGTWVYQVDEGRIKNLVAGKPRLEAIRLLTAMPGVAHITIAGIEDNKPLPDDVSHIHLLILVATSETGQATEGTS